jgi:exodeoxyribonuclease-3
LELKIISYNLNGIRSALRKGFDTWLESENPDVVLIQETKAQPHQVDSELFENMGYHVAVHSAEKNGYSGVAIFSKKKPDNIVVGCGMDKYDREGRVLRADFGDLSILSTYFPSGSSGEERQALKMDFLGDFQNFVNELKRERPKLIIGGDYNICHKPIDIHNPVSNKNSSGFLPEEREWLGNYIDSGFVDSFREFHPEPDRYSWWSYRFNARKKNLGWRIDYLMVSEIMRRQIKDANILESVVHSDHCPIMLKINIKDG